MLTSISACSLISAGYDRMACLPSADISAAVGGASEGEEERMNAHLAVSWCGMGSVACL